MGKTLGVKCREKNQHFGPSVRRYGKFASRGQFHQHFLAAFVPVVLRPTYWRTAQSVQRKSWAYLSVVCFDKVDSSFVGETEWRQTLTASAKY